MITMLFVASSLFAGAPTMAPRLAQPDGRVVRVSNVEDIYRAVRQLESNTTIVLEAGEYRLHRPIHFHRALKNVAIRGATGQHEDVIIRGAGMNSKEVWHGIMVDRIDGMLIADMTIGWVGYHPVSIQSACRSIRIYHCRLVDAGEQFVKASSGGNGGGADAGVVEYCVIGYTKWGPRNGYTNGVDVHGGKNWIIRHNLFRNIRTPRNAEYTAVPAVLVWNGAEDTICEANTFLNCDRAIALGLDRRAEYLDHKGGIVRNNFIYATKHEVPHLDAGITIQSPGAKVLHNTILHNGGYRNAIETRWPTTTNVEVINNLTDGKVTARNGASMKIANNVTNAQVVLFENAANADLHLVAGIHRGERHPDCPEDWDEKRRVTRQVSVGASEFGVRDD